jgi:hypothetical protein
MEMTKSMLNSISSNHYGYLGGYSNQQPNQHNNNPFKIDNPYSDDQEDISWLI